MSHLSVLKKYDDNEGSGPRPPIPGEESRTKEMTEGLPDSSRNTPPSCLNWALTLNHLLEDRDGVELLKKYVEEEAPAYNDHLNFYFACEGLKQQTDPEKIKQIIGAIYRFLKKSQLPVSGNLRQTVKAGLKNEVQLNPNVYDSLQQSVEVIIRDDIYPNFLESPTFLDYVNQMSIVHGRVGSGHTFSGSGSGSSGASCGSNASAANASGVVYPSNLQLTSGKLPSSSIGALINLPSSSMSAVPGSVCMTSGSVYGPSTSASSSGSVSAADTLPRSSTLPTLHEDSELSFCDDFDKLRVKGGRMSAEMSMRLTNDMLLATQARRLEIRPPGALGYVYPTKTITSTSYVPNSRVDSERASVSSGGRTDSDTMSLSNCSIDGRPYIPKKHSSSESKAIRQSAEVNKETNTYQVIPRTQRLHSNEHHPLKGSELMALLLPKLEELKRRQDLEERAERSLSNEVLQGSERIVNDRIFVATIREKFSLDEDNDQDILDQHVSRVWKDQTPHRSPGTISPCPPLPSRRRTVTHDSGIINDASMSLSGHSMKHSKSMPDQSSSNKKLTNKWPSMNTDSGISLVSADLTKYKDASLRSGSNTSTKLEEAKRRLEDETRNRSRRYTQQQYLSPMQHHSLSSSSSGSNSLHHQPQPPPLPAKPRETTTVVFSFCDEDYPYRTKIPGTHPTLKQFKDYLPKKGNFRFFFKTHCDEPDSPVIQEEIVNDSDILPLFEGKVMGLVKPSE